MARDTLQRLRITQVVPDSQAERLKLMKGDILLRYDGKLISTSEELSEAKNEVRGETVRVVILRGDDEIALTLEKGKIGVFTETEYY